MTQGYLNCQYTQIEALEKDSSPYFIVEIITLYFRDSPNVIAALEHELWVSYLFAYQNPLDIIMECINIDFYIMFEVNVELDLCIFVWGCKFCKTYIELRVRRCPTARSRTHSTYNFLYEVKQLLFTSFYNIFFYLCLGFYICIQWNILKRCKFRSKSFDNNLMQWMQSCFLYSSVCPFTKPFTLNIWLNWPWL